MTQKADPSTIDAIRQSSRLLVRELNVLQGVYHESGYSFSQCHILFELSIHKSQTLMDLVAKLLIDKSSASRSLKQLVNNGAIKAVKDSVDNRQKHFSLTRKGHDAVVRMSENAEVQVSSALENLTKQQQETVVAGLQLYESALRRSRLQSGFQIRPIKKKDNVHVANIIREVMTEYKAVGEGYSINDPEVDDIYGNYRESGHRYYVISNGDNIVGGAGIGPLKGEQASICELRKMFFLPETRGVGLGRKLLVKLMDDAREIGYRKCYLETLDRMWQAVQLYEKNGFKELDQPMGQTGHTSCDRWFLKEL